MKYLCKFLAFLKGKNKILQSCHSHSFQIFYQLLHNNKECKSQYYILSGIYAECNVAPFPQRATRKVRVASP
jgi:hypothetical protein